jgi:hypothetical protein
MQQPSELLFADTEPVKANDSSTMSRVAHVAPYKMRMRDERSFLFHETEKRAQE